MDKEPQRRYGCSVDECEHEAVRWVTTYSDEFECWLRLQFCELHFSPYEKGIATFEVSTE